MAHDIEQQADGTWSFVAARQPGWHNLGKTYADKTGLDLATVLADLNVGEIITAPVEAIVPGSFTSSRELVTIPGKKMTIRRRSNAGLYEHVPLGIVGDDYTVLSEAEVFAWTQNLVDASGAVFETAMLLDGGRRAAVSLRFPDGVRIGGVDPVDLYLVAAFSHDGSMALTGMATPIRVVCANTLTWGMQQAKQIWKIRHTKHASKQMSIDIARRNLDLSFGYFGELQREAEDLLKVHLTNKQFEEIVTNLYRADKTYKTEAARKAEETKFEMRWDRLMGLFTGDTQANIAKTAWAGLNALTEEVDWYRGAREVPADELPGHMFERSIMGTQTPEKTRAANAVRAFAGM